MKKKTVEKSRSIGWGLVIFSKMAPKKVKTQGNRNNIKIKSKVNKQNRESKFEKKTKKDVKSIDNLKWLNKLASDGSVEKKKAVPEWLNNTTYKHQTASPTFDDKQNEGDNYPSQGAEDISSTSDPSEMEDVSSTSDASECNCSNSKDLDNNKGGILKRKYSSSNSIVTNYIKSSMDQVASFIVESALRFGQEHGVVVPDKNTPNVYEITSPDKKFVEKFKKIRFKMPNKTREDEKKLTRRSKKSYGRAKTPMPDRKDSHTSKSGSRETTHDSLEEILPILEKLKEEGNLITSDIDLEKLANTTDVRSTEHHAKNRSKERDRPRVRSEKLPKRVRSVSRKTSEDYPQEKARRKKFKRDSLELGRRRLRPANSSKKQDSSSPSLY